MKRGEEVSGKEGPIVERIRSKGGIRRQGGVKTSNRAFEVRSRCVRRASGWRVKVVGFTEAILRYKVVFIPTRS